MNLTPLVDIDHNQAHDEAVDHAHEEGLDDDDTFDNFDLSAVVTHGEVQEDKENDMFTASQLARAQNGDGDGDGDAVYPPRTPHISELLHTPPPTKRKLAEVEEELFAPTECGEPDGFSDLEEEFDPTAEVVPFDVLNLPNSEWEQLQNAHVEKIRQFAQSMVHNSMIIAFDVAHAGHHCNETTRLQLVKSIQKIEEEQEMHRATVAKFRRYAQYMEQGMKALG